MPAIATKRTQPHRFVPDILDAADPKAVAALYDQLEGRDVSTRESLESFIQDWEELNAVLTEAYTSAYVDMTSDTTNPAFEARFETVVENVMPVFEQRGFQLKQKLMASPVLEQLGSEYDMFLRDTGMEVEIFREENVPLLMEERKLDQEYEKIVGSQKAEFRGETYTLSQLAPFLEETDRATREEAWRARVEARMNDAPALDNLYDRMYQVRQRIARNASFNNFRDYKFKELKRADYTPEDCVSFHDAIEKYIVPVMVRDQERRKRLLGLDTLRPWDLSVDPEGHPPLRPFGTAEELREGCERIVNRIDPQLGGYFRRMIDERLLDLENRPGKSPGGYMEFFPDTGVPFIFMNAVGTRRDVEVLLHEGGHSFHYFLAQGLPIRGYHMTGAEFSEVASMTMELLSRPYLSEFYSEDDLRYLRDEQLRDALKGIPFIAMIDAFQHWVYTAEDHGAETRREKWAELEARFRPGIDWSGLEEYQEIGWQYQHVFSVPFYFVEYGIAQLAAFRIWLNSLHDERQAVEAYKRALALGGSRPLPELFRAAGAEFGLDDHAVSSIVSGTLAQIANPD